ncbi:MAG: ABC transporter substrate-binding protein [Pseudomonadota bacterium]
MRLTRRATLAGLGAVALARPALAQTPFKIFQITYRGETDVERGFRAYFEQRDIPVTIIHRSAELDPANVPAILEEVRAEAPDLVYTWGTPVTLGTFGRADSVDPDKHITDRPGVFTMVSAPTRSGVVPSRASSTRNITGTSHVVPPEPQLRAMEAYRPFKKLGVLYTSTEPNARAIVEAVRAFQAPMGFELIERTFRLDGDGKPIIDGAADLVDEIADEGAGWLYYLPDTFLSSNIGSVAPQATARGLPGFSATERLQGDALISLVSRYFSLGQLTAYKAEQILVQGVAPASIPIETLQRFALIINMPLAKQLSLYPPLGMLSYADVLTAG